MIKENKWYIETMIPQAMLQPNCFVCGDKMDCMAEIPCETHMHIKCFNEVKNEMKGN